MDFPKSFISILIAVILLLALIFIKQLTLFNDPKMEAASDAIIGEVEEGIVKGMIQ